MSISHDDVVAMWGAAQVRVFPMEHMEGLGMHASAQPALGEIGVPADAGFLFVATALEDVPIGRYGRAVRFGRGWNEEYELCVAHADGTVYASHREVLELTFVNSDAVRFVEFLWRAASLHRQYDRADAASIDKSEYLREVDQSLAYLRELDPTALVDGAWWTGVLDEFKLI